jgi:hypothetical protein
LKDEAIDEVAHLIRLPSFSDSHLNVFVLRSSPWLAPLRGQPRFEAIIQNPANNEAL